ncbi:hypothetical protein MKW92_018087, partial [Papaver armeniacum]
MASSNGIIIVSLVIFLQSSLTAAVDLNLSPLLSPFLEDVCKEIGCGKGKCIASMNSTIDLIHPFKCECEPGTMDYSCNAFVEPPMPQLREPPSNESLFDRTLQLGLLWARIGHKCECMDGYENLLNVTAFPCLRECAIGMDCLKLGIAAPNRTTNSTPNMPDMSGNHASTILHAKFL